MRYRLPLGAGEVEIEAEEVWGGCAGGRPEYHLAGGFTVLAPKGEPLERVKPPLPEEPPPGYYLLSYEPRAYLIVCERDDDDWHLAAQEGPFTWAQVQEGYPGSTFTRLVPDPFAEPVALPWERKSGSPYVFIATDGGDGYLGLTVGPTENTADGYSVTADGARDMARALWAAADAAEKEQS